MDLGLLLYLLVGAMLFLAVVLSQADRQGDADTHHARNDPQAAWRSILARRPATVVLAIAIVGPLIAHFLFAMPEPWAVGLIVVGGWLFAGLATFAATALSKPRRP